MSKIVVPSSPSQRVLYPRNLVIRVLTRVLSQKEALDEVLAEIENSGQFSTPTLAWLKEVCSGTLRWKGRLDFILDSISLKKKPSGWLRKALLLASYQLIVQDRAHVGLVVSETVSEVKAQEGEAPAKFANACLRKIADQRLQWRELTLRPENAQKDGAAWASFPEWLWKRILQQHGVEWSIAYAQASLERPKQWIRARSLDWKPTGAQEGPIPHSWEVTEGGSLIDRQGFEEGEFFVQDISSQTLVHEMTQVLKASLGSREISALDLCAAPGGKSIGLAWNGIQVTATDRTEKRIPLLKQNIERVHAHVQVIPWQELNSLGKKDFVWVDAPCSGTGL